MAPRGGTSEEKALGEGGPVPVSQGTLHAPEIEGSLDDIEHQAIRPTPGGKEDTTAIADRE